MKNDAGVGPPYGPLASGRTIFYVVFLWSPLTTAVGALLRAPGGSVLPLVFDLGQVAAVYASLRFSLRAPDAKRAVRRIWVPAFAIAFALTAAQSVVHYWRLSGGLSAARLEQIVYFAVIWGALAAVFSRVRFALLRPALEERSYEDADRAVRAASVLQVVAYLVAYHVRGFASPSAQRILLVQQALGAGMPLVMAAALSLRLHLRRRWLRARSREPAGSWRLIEDTRPEARDRLPYFCALPGQEGPMLLCRVRSGADPFRGLDTEPVARVGEPS
jgi:hypothetical protein